MVGVYGVVGLDPVDPGDVKLEVDEEKSNFNESNGVDSLLVWFDHANPLSSDLRDFSDRLEDGLFSWDLISSRSIIFVILDHRYLITFILDHRSLT